jgi:hypothetical protein
VTDRENIWLYIYVNVVQIEYPKEIKMKATRSQASKRLFKKLSALRATLSNEERQILDNIVVTEVAAHKMTSKAVGKAVGKATNKATQAAAHKMTDKAVGKATNKATEAAAHKMTDKAVGKAVGKATNKATSKTTFRIAFDPNSEEYKIQE